MREKKSILLAMRKCADSDNIREQLVHRYNVLMAGMAKAVSTVFDHRHPDLLLLCADLPGIGGLSLVKNLRKYFDGPIILLTKHSEENAIVEALDAGVNDVLTLPFGRPEHLARIRALLRFSSSILKVSDGEFAVGGLTINYASRTICVDGKAIHLTPIEFRIMTLLTVNAGKVLTHDQIINEIWGPYNSDNLVLRVNMANIRRKIEANPAEPKYVITEVGVGYRVIGE